MSETVLGEYGIKASKMAPSQMQAVEHMAAEYATIRARVAELEAERGTLPDGAHPDEAKPRAETWLAERANWTAEVERIRAWVAVLETQLATTRAEERERIDGILAFRKQTAEVRHLRALITPTPTPTPEANRE